MRAREARGHDSQVDLLSLVAEIPRCRGRLRFSDSRQRQRRRRDCDGHQNGRAAAAATPADACVCGFPWWRRRLFGRALVRHFSAESPGRVRAAAEDRQRHVRGRVQGEEVQSGRAADGWMDSPIELSCLKQVSLLGQASLQRRIGSHQSD